MALVTCADGNATVCAQDSRNFLEQLNLKMDVLLPTTTTTLQHIDDGTVIDSMLHNDAAVWLTGIFCAFVFIMGWRAAE